MRFPHVVVFVLSSIVTSFITKEMTIFAMAVIALQQVVKPITLV
jgi:hypothetical protein